MEIELSMGLNTWISFVMGLFPMMKDEIGWSSGICLSDSSSLRFTLHRRGVYDIRGSFSHLFLRSSIEDGVSVRKCHQGLGASCHAGSINGIKPSLALTVISGNMNFHAFYNLSLNHPIMWVGFAWISAITTSGISTTIPSKLIAHLNQWEVESWNLWGVLCSDLSSPWVKGYWAFGDNSGVTASNVALKKALFAQLCPITLLPLMNGLSLSFKEPCLLPRIYMSFCFWA